MTLQELIRDYEFSSNVRNEMFIAYDESPRGFERVAKRAAEMNNPPAALTSMIRKGAHLRDETTSKRDPLRWSPEPYVVCDPEVRDHWLPIILAKLGRVGAMPSSTPTPDDLVAQLRKAMGEAA